MEVGTLGEVFGMCWKGRGGSMLSIEERADEQVISDDREMICHENQAH